jgi:ribosomal protein S18 acetylase RimI-like enzyme
VLRKGQNATGGCGTSTQRGEYHANIYNVVVDPKYQRRGIGSRVMSELLARLPVWRGLLVADRKVQPFYRRLGFESYGNVMAAAINQDFFDPVGDMSRN